ncbi:hypothetical protein HIM_06881 [Hirsutella minnesotensis 3608]|uniref:non-specific serine/threonine protein kinase n=1 Tax=Hirsutella minnesotensis 3608 TaxID=1043627 RepID=A0A0F7ZTV3_9HYPO|nr:hypothetical protein HIM_06881 [Hirsutella minnesotensis 3608]
MGDRGHGWTTVGTRVSGQRLGRAWQADVERKEREAIAAWEKDEHWPGLSKPLFNGGDAKRFDARLIKLDDLGSGAFGRVDKVSYGSVALARKRILRRRGLTIDDLRQEGLTMAKLDHGHVVRLVATYAPRSHELCLLIWPAAVCSLSVLLDDLEALRLGDGDGEDIAERLDALGLASKDGDDCAAASSRSFDDGERRAPFDFLCTVLGCVARAMAYCHANGVRHLDIKPSNILLNPDRVYLADFGISKDVSGQDQTTTDGLPGTEKWRAPELYGDHGSSMQLSDMYSLGLVYLAIATVLYKARLADLENALSYSHRLCLEDRLRGREDRIRKHLEKLTAHALVVPRHMFTHDGQETVRPRPVVGLVSQMVASNPRSRPCADKVDEKLSMLGGIHQIYHAECCRRPVSWVEDRWDRKLTALAGLKDKCEQQRRRIRELEGKDETYEARIENARRAHEHDVARLQALLREAEDKCQRLEMEKNARRRLHGQDARREAPGPGTSGLKRPGPVMGSPAPAVPGWTRPRAGTGTRPAAQPAMQPKRPPSRPCQPPARGNAYGTQQQSNAEPPLDADNAQEIKSLSQRSPSLTNWSEYQLRSRGSGSKLPLPVTPSRSETPVLGLDQSMTDSSMSSSIFSRHSIETAATPAHHSPQPQPQRARRLSPASTPRSPVLSMTGSVLSDAAFMSDLAGAAAATMRPARPAVPSLQSTKSWADVAKLDQRPSTGRA